ncbi:hypothetical protein BGW80DRAFT_1256712 [Lactifluus volemus]|nr:hypothetical protein BGW80DRAFT_1256712 [Lactifluus volemus]
MQRGSHVLSSTPPYQYNSLHTAEALLPVRGPDPELLPDERVPGVAFAGPSATMNRPGYPTPSQHTSNVGYEPSSQVSSFGEQPLYAYQGSQSADAHYVAGAPQNIYDRSIAPGLLLPEYYAPPVRPQEIPNDVIINRAPQLPNVAIPFQGLPGPVPPGMSIEEELRQLAHRYFYERDSRVNKVRVRHSRRSGKVKVMILLELDEME